MLALAPMEARTETITTAEEEAIRLTEEALATEMARLMDRAIHTPVAALMATMTTAVLHHLVPQRLMQRLKLGMVPVD